MGPCLGIRSARGEDVCLAKASDILNHPTRCRVRHIRVRGLRFRSEEVGIGIIVGIRIRIRGLLHIKCRLHFGLIQLRVSVAVSVGFSQQHHRIVFNFCSKWHFTQRKVPAHVLPVILLLRKTPTFSKIDSLLNSRLWSASRLGLGEYGLE